MKNKMKIKTIECDVSIAIQEKIEAVKTGLSLLSEIMATHKPLFSPKHCDEPKSRYINKPIRNHKR